MAPFLVMLISDSGLLISGSDLHCSLWCVSCFLCFFSVIQSHILTAFLLYMREAPRSLLGECTFSLLPQINKNSPAEHGLQICSESSLVWKSRFWLQDLTDNGERASFGVFKLVQSLREIFPSRKDGWDSFPGVWLPLILHWKVVFLSRGRSGDKVIQSWAVTVFPRYLWM